MPKVPLNQWNLSFISEDLERQYQEQQQHFQLLLHQTMTACGTVVALICLIAFVAEKQSLLLILEMAVGAVILFLELIFSKKLLPYIKKFYALNYLACVVMEAYINYFGNNIPQYILGHAYFLTLFCCLLLCHNPIKLIYLISTPIVMLVLSDAISLNNLYLILYIIDGIVCMTLAMYWIEHNVKEAFYNGLMAKKYKELLYEYSTEGLFAISLNERTQQFESEFENKNVKEVFLINDQEEMKSFLRNAILFHEEDGLQRKHQHLTNLEENIFKKIKDTNSHQPEQLQVKHDSNNKITFYQISLRIINLGKVVLLITIKYNHVKELVHQHEKQINYYNTIIIDQSTNITKNLQQFMLALKKLQQNGINRKTILSLKCINLNMRNLINNYLIYFQQEKFININQTLHSYQFNNFIQSLSLYFHHESELQDKNFQLINKIPLNLYSRVDSNILTQILINLFQMALKDSQFQSKIILKVTVQQNLNPNYNYNKVTLGDNHTNECLEESQGHKSQNQLLLQFIFSYEVHESSQEEIIEFKNQIDGQLCNNDESERPNIPDKVTNLLLERIGPYNHTNFSEIFMPELLCYQRTVKCYIYTDQTLLDQSYTQFLKPPSHHFF